MTAPYVLGVDGGDTKTVALVAGSDGTVLGAARSTGSDIYSYPDPIDAVAVLADVTAGALAEAGLTPEALDAAVFCLGGADWPEDIELLDEHLRRFLPDGCDLEILHDSQGHLWAGHPSGVGVAVAFGTGLAIGARNEDGRTWSSTNWVELSGSTGLGQDGLQAVFRAHLGVGSPTVLSDQLPRRLGVDSVDELSHQLTNRLTLGKSHASLATFGPVVLDAAAAGDPVAEAIVARHVHLVAEYVRAAAALVGLEQPFPVSVGGGPTRHEAQAVLTGLRDALGPSSTVRLSTREPAAGALVKALSATRGGISADVLAQVDETTPGMGFFATLGVAS